MILVIFQLQLFFLSLFLVRETRSIQTPLKPQSQKDKGKPPIVLSRENQVWTGKEEVPRLGSC